MPSVQSRHEGLWTGAVIRFIKSMVATFAFLAVRYWIVMNVSLLKLLPSEGFFNAREDSIEGVFIIDLSYLSRVQMGEVQAGHKACMKCAHGQYFLKAAEL